MTWNSQHIVERPNTAQPRRQRRLPAMSIRVSVRAIAAVLAASALLAPALAPGAYAQQTTQQQTKQQGIQTTMPSTGSTGQQSSQATTQQQGTTAQVPPAPQGQNAAKANQGTAKAQAKPIDGQIAKQPDGTYLASKLIGSSVKSPRGENIGQISNLVVDNNSNKIVGVVIGVGGFLGFGEKPIAVKPDQLKLTTTKSGSEQLVLNATRKDLENAPKFVSLSAEKAQQTKQPMQAPGTGTAPNAGTTGGQTTQ